MICTSSTCDTQPGHGITLCHDHTTQLEADLDRVPGILADLWDSTIRATHYTDTVSAAKGNEPPLIIDLDANTLGRELAALIRSWTSLILDHGAPAPDDVRSPAVCARWLRGQVSLIRSADWAGDLCDEIHEAVWRSARGTDRPAPRVFAGMCPTDIDGNVCGSPLYARPGAGVARCRVCGADWDVQSWRFDALLAAAMETGTPAQISRMLTDPVTGEALPQGTIRSWVSRGLLTHVNEEERRFTQALRGRVPPKLYQVRKVRNLWVRMKASKYGNPTLKNGPRNTHSIA